MLESMNPIFIFALAIIALIIFLAIAQKKMGSRDYPYRRSKHFLSKAERSFYGVLVQSVGKTSMVFCKVRVADVITPAKGLNRSEWQSAFNSVSAKHFDFIICDHEDCSVKLAVELDDSSHSSPKAQKRDNFKNRACNSAGLPLLRIKAARGYSVAEIQRQIEEAISPPAPATTAQQERGPGILGL